MKTKEFCGRLQIKLNRNPNSNFIPNCYPNLNPNFNRNPNPKPNPNPIPKLNPDPNPNPNPNPNPKTSRFSKSSSVAATHVCLLNMLTNPNLALSLSLKA